ncbi:Hypothetical predicted protein [Cloeon dipterum]|uniref:Uncharacterized protein n=1 Tax=Cloeon dipterum TaxID=197152 RepID=A0A8S1CLV9_9INSE|nr:Hypothetical predicted protein [Cloeon dipterum]
MISAKPNKFLKNIKFCPTFFTKYSLKNMDKISISVDTELEKVDVLKKAYEQYQDAFFTDPHRLAMAATIADADQCRRLIDNGAASIDKDALHYAALNKKHGKELAKLLVNRGLSVDGVDSEGDKPIHRAIRAGNLEVADTLLQMDNEAKEGEKLNLLQMCVQENNLEWIQKVCEYDEDLILEEDRQGRSILHLAAVNCSRDTFQWLTEAGADPYAVSGDTGATVLHEACRNLLHGRKLVVYLDALRVNIHATDRMGLTPLHYALREENLDAASELIDSGADLRVRYNGSNLLLFCVRENKLSSARLVHQHDPNQIGGVDESGQNALQIAARFADVRMFQWLTNNAVKLSIKKGHFREIAVSPFLHKGRTRLNSFTKHTKLKWILKIS